DRAYREKIWKKITSTRLSHRETLDALFTDLVQLRTQIAENAGYKSYSDYKFMELGRFDYKREDCYDFHNSIEQLIKPQLLKLSEARRKNLDVDTLYHWDINVDELGEQPLKPFGNTDELIDKTLSIFDRLDDRMSNFIRAMKDMGHLDLDSRLGKAPGGYQYSLPETRIPFIFMNAVGTQSDLTTMLHEAGHAIHSFAARDIDLAAFNRVPSEVAELAAMTMELITLDYWNELYDDPKEVARACRDQILRCITLLPWIASIDAFQFWVYDHPNHTHAERAAKWKEIFLRFHGDYVSWEDHEAVLESFWQKQGHVFDVPFYYIEYGFAQLGAIAVWRNYRRDPDKGLADYLNALSMGYTRPIPELYEAAGIRFDFSEGYIRELVEFLLEELKKYEVN
ncbi:MAG: M3 family oligoendopeptidase, partial [Bacteroidota bacterium]